MKQILVGMVMAGACLGAAGCADGYRPQALKLADPDRHAQWCFSHHLHYNAATNQYLDQEGFTHDCN